MQREPIFKATIEASVNFDTGLLRVAAMRLAMQLGERQYAALPPHVQQFLREHEVRGTLAMSAKGEVPLNDPARAAGEATVNLQNARVAYRGLALPIEHVELNAQLPKAT